MPCDPSASNITSLYPVQPMSNPSNPSTTNNYKERGNCLERWKRLFLKNSTLPLLDCQTMTALSEGAPTGGLTILALQPI